MTYQCRRQCGRYCWRHCWTQRGRIRLITTIVRVITQLPDWLLLSRTFMLLTTNNLGRWGRTHEHDWNCNCTEEFHCEWIDRTLSWNLEIDVHLRSCRLDCVSDYETLVLIRGHPAATQLCWPLIAELGVQGFCALWVSFQGQLILLCPFFLLSFLLPKY